MVFFHFKNLLLNKLPTLYFLLGIFVLTFIYHSFAGLWEPTTSNDEAGYLRYAHHFWTYYLEGNVHNASDQLPFWWPPGGPFFYWMLIKLGFHDVLSLRVIMHLLGAFFPIACYFWSKRWLDAGGARWVCLLCALDPYFARDSGALNTDLIFSFLCLILFSLFFNKYSAKKIFMLGVFCGLFCLLRTAVIFFLPIVCLEIWRQRGLKASTFQGLCLGAGFFLGALPLLLRNYLLTEKIFFSSVVGFVFLISNNPFHEQEGYLVEGQGLRRAIATNPEISGLVDQDYAKTLPALERDDYYKNQVMGFLEENPHAYWLNGVFRVLGIFHLYPSAHPGLFRKFVLYSFILLTLLAIIGLVLTWKEPEFSWCRIAFGGVILLAFFTCCLPRYRFPIHSIIFLLDVVAFYRMSQKIKS